MAAVLSPTLTAKGLARELGHSAQTICAAAREGKIPDYKVRRTWRFDRVAIETWKVKQVTERQERDRELRMRNKNRFIDTYRDLP